MTMVPRGVFSVPNRLPTRYLSRLTGYVPLREKGEGHEGIVPEFMAIVSTVIGLIQLTLGYADGV